MRRIYAVLGFNPQNNLVNALKRGIALSRKNGWVKAIYNRQTSTAVAYIKQNGGEIVMSRFASNRESEIAEKLSAKLDLCFLDPR